MPKSRRVREVPLTQVEKKPKEAKEKLIAAIRSAASEYKDVYVLELRNMDSGALQRLRLSLKATSRMFAGGNHVMRAALGTSAEDSVLPNAWPLGNLLRGHAALLFTRASEPQVREALKAASQDCPAAGGEPAPATVTVPAGPLDQTDFPFSMEPELRGLGLPTALRDGVIEVLAEYTICTVGETLTGSQARLLRHFGHRLSTRSVVPLAVWRREGERIDLFDKSLEPLLKRKGESEGGEGGEQE